MFAPRVVNAFRLLLVLIKGMGKLVSAFLRKSGVKSFTELYRIVAISLLIPSSTVDYVFYLFLQWSLFIKLLVNYQSFYL